MNKRLKNGLVALTLGTSIIGLTGCRQDVPDFEKPSNYTLEELNIDQVFRDSYAWRLYSTDSSGEVQERKYQDSGSDDIYQGKIALPILHDDDAKKFSGLRGQPSFKHVKVFKDSPDHTPRALIVTYDTIPQNQSNNFKAYYVEIHLPVDGTISPGRNRIPGKPPVEEGVKEVK